MKYAYVLIIALVCLTARTSAQTERQLVQLKVKECQKESGSTVNEIENIRNGVITADTGKQALCVNRKLGVLDQNGDLIADKFKQHVDALTDKNDLREEFHNKCGKTEGENPEAKTIKFVKCMQSVLAKV
ncbi:B2 protein-like [Diabrotica undecimpunctata]|uniref:B2 protein-like n=1 Tax=Diabrotica undecimpunctata TaxID=50387 RepID=UPI003B634EC0